MITYTRNNDVLKRKEVIDIIIELQFDIALVPNGTVINVITYTRNNDVLKKRRKSTIVD